MAKNLRYYFDKLQAEVGEESDASFAKNYLFGMERQNYYNLKKGELTTAWRIALLFLFNVPGAMKKLRKWNEENKQP